MTEEEDRAVMGLQTKKALYEDAKAAGADFGEPRQLLTAAEADLAPDAKFNLGDVFITTGAMLRLSGPKYGDAILLMHQTGEWGAVCDEDKAANNQAIELGNRILSAYPINPLEECKGHGENTVWVITEADRFSTTILLPEEY